MAPIPGGLGGDGGEVGDGGEGERETLTALRA